MRANNLNDLLSDPCTFFYETTGLKPHTYQEWLLNHSLLNGSRIALLLSRRSGKSTVVASKLLYEALQTTKKDFRILMLAPKSEQCQFVYEPIQQALRHPILRALCRSFERTNNHDLRYSRECLEVPNRGGGISTIALLSGDNRGDARYLVGDRADVFLVEESALVAESTYLKVRECRRTGPYRAEILIGTPRNQNGFFYDSCRPVNDNWQYNTEYESENGYDVYHSDIYHCPHIANSPEIMAEVEQDRKSMPLEDWQTEAMACFSAGRGNFFPFADNCGLIICFFLLVCGG